MKNEAKHTPTPWKLETNYAWSEGTKDRGSIFSCNMKIGTHIPDDQNVINAAFICKAVNAHEELVTGLKRALALGTFSQEFTDEMKQIIAKAEGK